MGSEPTIFLIACLVSLALTALIREVAPRIGLTDNPDGYRKLHGRATPLGGGVAVYLTSAIILGTLWVAPSDLSTPEPEGNADTTISAPAESTSEGNGGTTSSASAESTSDGHAGDIASTSAESTSA
ncbi:MAG: hypothetical protein NTW96_03155 [Planctomycetia bacterium]|nr:hypothetical protein [Planctomycetia bacterium]